jgi:hypothetical protein
LLLTGFSLGLTGGAWLAGGHPAARSRAINPASETPAPATSAAATSPTFSTRSETLVAVMSALAEPEPLPRAHLLLEALGRLTPAEMAALFQSALKLEDWKQRNNLLDAVVKRWFAVDPKAAQAACQPYIEQFRAGGPSSWKAVSAAVYSAWLAARPQEALADAARHPGAFWASSTARETITSLSGNPARQLEALQQLPPGKLRSEQAVIVVRLLAWTDPASAQAALELVSDPKSRAEMQEQILSALAKTDCPTACARVVDAVSSLPHGASAYGLISQVWMQAGASAPEQALSAVDQLPEALRNRAIAATLLGWAKNDPTAALEWAAANGVDPDDMKVSAGGNGYGYRSMILEALSGDRAKTIAWLEARPPTDQTDDMIQSAMWQATPAEAERLLGHLTPEGMPAGAGQYISTLLASNPEAALAWASAQPAGAVRTAAIATLVGRQADKDPGNLAALTDAWSPGPDRDAALSGAASTLGYTQPAQAIALARQIGDEAARENALKQAVWSWGFRDNAGARAWLGSTPDLPPSLREELRKDLERD